MKILVDVVNADESMLDLPMHIGMAISGYFARRGKIPVMHIINVHEAPTEAPLEPKTH